MCCVFNVDAAVSMAIYLQPRPSDQPHWYRRPGELLMTAYSYCMRQARSAPPYQALIAPSTIPAESN